ncbi:10943_t:CDS:2, partial [Racocetra persica]
QCIVENDYYFIEPPNLGLLADYLNDCAIQDVSMSLSFKDDNVGAGTAKISPKCDSLPSRKLHSKMKKNDIIPMDVNYENDNDNDQHDHFTIQRGSFITIKQQMIK